MAVSWLPGLVGWPAQVLDLAAGKPGVEIEVVSVVGKHWFCMKDGKTGGRNSSTLNITVLADWDSTSPCSAVGTINRLRL